MEVSVSVWFSQLITWCQKRDLCRGRHLKVSIRESKESSVSYSHSPTVDTVGNVSRCRNFNHRSSSHSRNQKNGPHGKRASTDTASSLNWRQRLLRCRSVHCSIALGRRLRHHTNFSPGTIQMTKTTYHIHHSFW